MIDPDKFRAWMENMRERMIADANVVGKLESLQRECDKRMVDQFCDEIQREWGAK